MARLRNNKKSFPAHRRGNNIFQIKDSAGVLKPGQRVLISQKTNEPIIHYATGKEIGKAEIRFGVGDVLEKNNHTGTVTVRVGIGKELYGVSKDNIKMVKKSAVVKPDQIYRISAVKGVAAPKFFRKKTSERYIAKIIE